MSKITFRADDELVERIETHDASKSEVMREALRAYLDAERDPDGGTERADDSDDRRGPRERASDTDDPLVALIDRVIDERLHALVGERVDASLGRDPGTDDANSHAGSEMERRPRTRRREAPRRRARGRRPMRGDDRARAAVGEPVERRPARQGRVVVNVAPDLSDDAVSYGADAQEVGDRSHLSDAREAPETPRRSTDDAPSDATRASDERGCARCGTELSDDHVYCPNCGEKASRRLFCDCGDEVRSDWSFCPGCGRRTPAADVLDANATNESDTPNR